MKHTVSYRIVVRSSIIKIMQLFKLLIFFLALSRSECHFGILEEKIDRVESVELAKKSLTTLLSCYVKKVKTVGVAGISDRILHKILSEQSIPVALIGEDTVRAAVVDPHRKVDNGSCNKLQLFVVEASSSQQLDRILETIENSQWSNQMATYLIIDWPSQKSQEACSNAFNYLSIAWNRNLLNALYVCLDKPERKVPVYTYNPYTSLPPWPWQIENTYKGKKGHPWTMLVREYHPGKIEICNNLDFDKTHNHGSARENENFMKPKTPTEN